jgi:hypothetical protein
VREENAKGGKRAEEYAAAALDAQGKQAFPAGFHNLLGASCVWMRRKHGWVL